MRSLLALKRFYEKLYLSLFIKSAKREKPPNRVVFHNTQYTLPTLVWYTNLNKKKIVFPRMYFLLKVVSKVAMFRLLRDGIFSSLFRFTMGRVNYEG